MAIGGATGLGPWAPFVVNVIAMAVAVYVAGMVLRDFVWTQLQGVGMSWMFLAGICLCLLSNSWGLVMTGLEHPLHLALAFVVLHEGARISISNSASGWAMAVSAAMLPLVRFEGAALAGMAFVYLLAMRRIRPAILLLFLLASLAGCWAFYMHSLGLPFMPSSVQMKSSIVSGAVGSSGLPKLSAAIFANFLGSIGTRQGLLLTLATVGLLSYAVFSWKQERSRAWLALLAAVPALAHVILGRYGWFSRYEVYALASAGLVALIVGRAALANPVLRMTALAAMLFAAVPYAKTTYQTPAACRNTYEQQFQMHRFAVEYWKGPVAVNDLGLVSYRNPSYVLDLCGLGSEEVRIAKLNGTFTSTKISEMVDKRGVRLVMIYDEWFTKVGIPAAWRKVGTLTTSRVSSAGERVSFYAVDAEAAPRIREMLGRFASTLPAGATVSLEP